MPFATWELDAAFTHFVNDTLYALARARSPLLAGMGQMQTASTVSSVVSGHDGAELSLPETPVGASMTLDLEAVRTANFEQLTLELDSAAEELGKGLVELFVDTIGKVTDFTGNTIKSKGGLTFESYVEMLERIEWSLDEDDQLVKPSLVVHPDTAKKFPQGTAEQLQTIRDLEDRKHRELLARRRRRRLS
ncbi:hypothetical protein [Patulibacter americanus]|uniref:hypothetical protein n=1 Tax=Patulibacter americanus TaxID=588672 RepID=UPI0003B756B0|nr:hypothetical protein [Patulibacter americanus]